MSIERIVLAFAGSMIILSLLLSYFVSPYWLALAAFVGVNLVLSGFTNLCVAEMILCKLGWGVRSNFDARTPQSRLGRG